MGRVTVIGAGPAGMMAAISAARVGARVTLFEKNDEAGKKLLLTGGGRCNLLNLHADRDLTFNYPGGGPFLYSAFSQVSPQDLVAFFRELGLELKEEEAGKVFPQKGRAGAVREVLLGELGRLGVEIRYQSPKVTLSELAEPVILATGGASYPQTGSSGDGYRLAQAAGHRLVAPKAALVPLHLEEEWPRELAGLSCFVELRIKVRGRTVRHRGQLLFTHFGLSGPVALNLSRELTPPQTLELNFLPQRPADLFAGAGTISQRLSSYLPRRLSRQLLILARIDPAKEELSGKEEARLSDHLFALPLTVSETRGLPLGMVTRGGVELREVEPQTMASKLCPHLYFAGEVLDLDGLTGGYNLTAAFVTGCVAGRAAGGS